MLTSTSTPRNAEVPELSQNSYDLHNWCDVWAQTRGTMIYCLFKVMSWGTVIFNIKHRTQWQRTWQQEGLESQQNSEFYKPMPIYLMVYWNSPINSACLLYWVISVSVTIHQHPQFLIRAAPTCDWWHQHLPTVQIFVLVVLVKYLDACAVSCSVHQRKYKITWSRGKTK